MPVGEERQRQRRTSTYSIVWVPFAWGLARILIVLIRLVISSLTYGLASGALVRTRKICGLCFESHNSAVYAPLTHVVSRGR